MGVLDWINPINKAIGIVDQYVEDKDQANQLKAELSELKERSYQIELQTKTVPWIDGLHKMGRQLLSWASLLIPAVLLAYDPKIDPLAIAAMVGPGGVYNYAKGKGRQ